MNDVLIDKIIRVLNSDDGPPINMNLDDYATHIAALDTIFTPNEQKIMSNEMQKCNDLTSAPASISTHIRKHLNMNLSKARKQELYEYLDFWRHIYRSLTWNKDTLRYDAVPNFDDMNAFFCNEAIAQKLNASDQTYVLKGGKRKKSCRKKRKSCKKRTTKRYRKKN